MPNTLRLLPPQPSCPLLRCAHRLEWCRYVSARKYAADPTAQARWREWLQGAGQHQQRRRQQHEQQVAQQQALLEQCAAARR
jgi:hypothetical protein